MEYMFLLAGKKYARSGKLQRILLFPEEKQSFFPIVGNQPLLSRILQNIIIIQWVR
jgi:hypothetical protein